MYFKELPNVQYPSPLSDRASDREYVTIKNIFRRAKLRDDLISELTAFDEYEIKDGQRPDIVADDYYGNPELDWLVLICNNIVNIKDQWPLSDKELYEFASEKYGNEINDIAFYESTEVRDDMNRLVYPAGIVVDSDFEIIDPDDSSTIIRPLRSVTNYEYEIRKNEEKRSITLLKEEYVTQALIDLREELSYDKSSQYVNRNTIKADNIRLKSYD
jgi:hypothetical protein